MKGYDPTAIGLSEFKIAGLEAKLRCPFHLDHSPSARFNLVSGLFHCFGCGTSANAHQLARMLGGEVVRIDVESIVVEDDPKEWMQLLYSRPAYGNRYLKHRGVTNEQIEKFGIMQTADGVLFPVKNRAGTIIGLQMRRYDGEPRYVLYGQKTPVWPLANLKYEYLTLVEGVFGVLRGDKFGFQVVCAMGASAIPPAAAALEGRKVKILFDDDIAGYLGAYSFMKLHKSSTAVVPGVEADEMTFAEWAYNIGLLGTRDIVGFAQKRKMLELLEMIKQKEIRHGEKGKVYHKHASARKARKDWRP